MSATTAVEALPGGSSGGVDDDLDVGLARPAVAVLCAAALVAVLAAGRWIQLGEAALSTLVARATGVHDAHRVGTAVVFELDGRAVGYGITLGCTVAFLLLPFVLGTAVVLTVQRTTALRALAALAAAVAVVAACNQLRLLVILSGIRLLGLERGYSATHVLVGTALSTVGVVTAALLFLHIITQPTRRRLQRRSERAQEAPRPPAAAPVAALGAAPVTAPAVVVLPAASAIPTQRSARTQTPEDRRG
ncbi:hypothetical protein [Quadrisphaera sp. INWT6]|uniref:hypothetical protein n=1 Tax=Quadrisphaera sp. INWT6 TaxID=2596917 RepID=UPI0018926232|nr:hypothetical protein [Quadrisphaera sp. INWT6]MBF5081989.1 exosortase/archaeosortase family protein [Quadrisphaera sp. INWT6]